MAALVALAAAAVAVAASGGATAPAATQLSLSSLLSTKLTGDSGASRVQTESGCTSDVFVSSVDGDDSADGCTAKTPVATLAHAQQLSWARKKSAKEQQDVTVWLSGEFYLKQGLKFSVADKGVRWTSHILSRAENASSQPTAAPAPATIYGGVVLPAVASTSGGWMPVTDAATLARVKDPVARGKLWQLSLASPSLNLSSAEIGYE